MSSARRPAVNLAFPETLATGTPFLVRCGPSLRAFRYTAKVELLGASAPLLIEQTGEVIFPDREHFTLHLESVRGHFRLRGDRRRQRRLAERRCPRQGLRAVAGELLRQRGWPDVRRRRAGTERDCAQAVRARGRHGQWRRGRSLRTRRDGVRVAALVVRAGRYLRGRQRSRSGSRRTWASRRQDGHSVRGGSRVRDASPRDQH